MRKWLRKVDFDRTRDSFCPAFGGQMGQSPLSAATLSANLHLRLNLLTDLYPSAAVVFQCCGRRT